MIVLNFITKLIKEKGDFKVFFEQIEIFSKSKGYDFPDIDNLSESIKRITDN